MPNKWGIPDVTYRNLKIRDTHCVYCHKTLLYPYDRRHARQCGTLEHFNEAGPFYWWKGLEEVDIAMCCGSCNSSRGAYPLFVWFARRYCLERGITVHTVAKPVKDHLVLRRKV